MEDTIDQVRTKEPIWRINNMERMCAGKEDSQKLEKHLLRTL